MIQDCLINFDLCDLRSKKREGKHGLRVGILVKRRVVLRNGRLAFWQLAHRDGHGDKFRGEHVIDTAVYLEHDLFVRILRIGGIGESPPGDGDQPNAVLGCHLAGEPVGQRVAVGTGKPLRGVAHESSGGGFPVVGGGGGASGFCFCPLNQMQGADLKVQHIVLGYAGQAAAAHTKRPGRSAVA